jgi:hypothetical protein
VHNKLHILSLEKRAHSMTSSACKFHELPEMLASVLAVSYSCCVHPYNGFANADDDALDGLEAELLGEGGASQVRNSVIILLCNSTVVVD